MGFFEKIKQGLSKTASSISSVFTASELDDDFYDDLEERLILADLGMDTTVKAVERLRLVVRDRRIKTVAEAREALREVLCDMLDVGDSALNLSTKPSVVLVIGVNGVGKTTTIGKIANQRRPIPSARRRPISSRSGPGAPMPTSSGRAKEPTRRRSCSMRSRRRRRAAWM